LAAVPHEADLKRIAYQSRLRPDDPSARQRWLQVDAPYPDLTGYRPDNKKANRSRLAFSFADQRPA
jgi:hypothetical protein